MTDVPCNGCTLCCHGPIILHPALGDDPDAYQCDLVPDVGYRLRRKPDGSCIYLRENGCSIWPNTPGVCRAFDCRQYAKMNWAKFDPLADDGVLERGLELLGQLNAA